MQLVRKLNREMKRRYTLLLYIVVLMLVVGCADRKKDTKHAPQPKDTLYTAKRALDIYGDDPEKALQIIDSAEILGNASEFKAELIRARIYAIGNNAQKLDTAQQICTRLLLHDSVKVNPENHRDVLEQLTYICRLRCDNERYLQYATELAKLCQTMGKQTEALRTEAEIGLVQTYLGYREEGLARIDHTINLLDKQRRFNELDATIIALKRKVHVLDDMKRVEEIIPVAQRIIDKLDDYAQHPDDYADGSYREPANSEQRAKYIEFYRAQAIAFLAGSYAMISEKQGKKSKAYKNARYYTDLYAKTDFSKTPNGQSIITDAWLYLGDYDKLLRSYDNQEQSMGTDTLHTDYVKILRGRAIVAAARGNYAESQNYWRRYADVSHTVNDKLQQGKAHEYAALYHEHEQKLEIEHIHRISERNALIAAIIGIVALFAIGMVIWYRRQQHIISHKNRALVKQISETMEYQHQYEQLRDNLRSDDKDGNPDIGHRQQESGVNSKGEHEQKAFDTMSNEQLFDYIRNIIQSRRLFLDPSFDRQTVINTLKLTKEQVGAAFSQGSQYASITDFVNKCRLEYACQLLTGSDMSIDDVATNSGFNTRRTFSRCFKEKYELTPSEFRSLYKVG